LKINSISSVGIIYRKSNPEEVFFEIKDDGLPVKAFRRMLNPIGGNWVGEVAKSDQNTWDTFKREIREELNLDGVMVSTVELRLLGYLPQNKFYKTKISNCIPSDTERKMFGDLKEEMIKDRIPFGDYLINIPMEYFNKGELDKKVEDWNDLNSYWLIPLSEKNWGRLVYFQNKFGNLSRESISTITSLREIVETRMSFAFGHDRPIRDFFMIHNAILARKMPILKGIVCSTLCFPRESYGDYLKKYEVVRKPNV
jgi:hypothetical protein